MNASKSSTSLIFANRTSSSISSHEFLFPNGRNTFVRDLTSSSDKSILIDEVTSLIGEDDEEHSILSQKASLMLDEMLENALYAAPRLPNGALMYPLRKPRDLAFGEMIRLRYYYDGVQLVLEVQDSWGSLTQKEVLSCLSLNLQESHPDPERTGRGFFFIWEILNNLYIRISPGIETVVGGSLSLQSI